MAQAEYEEVANRWILLVAVMAGTFMVVLDNIVINLAVPYIMTAFGTNIEHAKWASIGFMIAATVSMPLSNWLAQRLGYGPLYISALIVFTAGAGLSTLSWSLNSLILGRLVQGLGAGVVQPVGIAILTRNFPPHMRGRTFGIYSTGVMFAPILGPTAAGLLIETFSWRSIFTMSLIVGSAVLLLAVSVFDREREEAPGPFDFKGYLSLAVFLVTTLLTLSYGQEKGWTSGIILLGWAVALVAFLLFIILEFDAPEPIMPLRLFRIPDFSLALILTVYKSLARAGAGFLLPIFLQRVQGRESLQIGLMLMPGALINSLFNPLCGYLTDRFGGRWLTVTGTLLIVYYLYLYTAIDYSSGIWLILAPQFFRGIGISLINTPVMSTGLNAISRQDAGHASWMINLSQRVGGALSITLISSLLHRQTVIQRDYVGGSALATVRPPQELIQQAIGIGYSSYSAHSAVRAAFGKALGRAANVRAYQNLYYLLGFGVFTSVLPAYLLNRFRPPPEPEPRDRPAPEN
ncbi:MAG: DHA2 family efflux MFS transporter permease subunit [SAR324 cluster bacterium]|nr:DHA2 family efflux MFS transporter permease subunit [SAR324 cluster bacterium]